MPLGLEIPDNPLTLVRRRPGMYLGEVDPSRLVMEVAKALILKNSRKVSIAVSGGKRARVSADFHGALPQLRDETPSMRPIAEELFTFRTEDVDSHEVSPFWAIAVANALSKQLRVTLNAMPSGLRQDYARGERVGGLCLVRGREGRWTLAVEFVIDDQIFETATISRSKLRRFCSAAGIVFPAVSMRLTAH